jgi:undecaprenol kinase
MSFRVVRPESADAGPDRPQSTLRLKGATRGVKNGARGSARFFGHLFNAAIVVAAGVVLGCTSLEWAGLVLALGLIFTVELLNHALQAVARECRSAAAAEAAAGAVLMALGTGLAAEVIILGRRLAAYYSPAF